MNEVEKQRQYYKERAASYDQAWAFDEFDEHYVATAALRGLLDLYKISSVLDIGCGSGRSLKYLKDHAPELQLSGIEPVEALRTECLAKGFSAEQVRVGDACHLDLPDSSIDCVCMFGVLHHVRTPVQAVDEALRVAKKMVFISDHNIYGMGNIATRTVKQTFRMLGMRKLLGSLMTGGKGYHDTDWDGVFYPFSLLDHFQQLRNGTARIYSFSTKTPAVNLLRNASHVAIAAVK